jgi:flagellar protein FlaG
MEITPIGKAAGGVAQAAMSPASGITVSNYGGASRPAVPAVQSTSAVQQASPAASSKQLEQAIKDINKALQEQGRGLQFEIDPETRQSIVKVVDTETNQVIRQMPTKDALDIAHALDRLQSLLVRQKA